jgi:outer membrane protein assembly factor BamB
MTVAGGRLFTLGNSGRDDVLVCLDAKTGESVWRYTYPCSKGSHGGPRATPVVVEDRVYALSREGLAYCVKAGNGEAVWTADLTEVADARAPRWGFAGSAWIEGDMVLFNAGRSGAALEKATGRKVWASESGIGGYATPVAFDAGGRRLAGVFGKEDFYVVKVQDGAVVGSFPWKTSWDVNAADPIPLGDRIFISSGYKHGCALLEVGADGLKRVWENDRMCSHFSTPVLVDGAVYGCDGNTGRGALVCLDPATGREYWRRETGFGSLICAGGKIIFLEERGTLIVAQAVKDGYREVARATGVLDKTCWTSPVLAGGRIFCRNHDGDLVCVDVRK